MEHPPHDNPDDHPQERLPQERPGEGAPREPAGEASSAEWLRGDGDVCDVVMSSRVRMARNLRGFPFSTKASRRERAATLEACRNRIMGAQLSERMIWVDLHTSPPLERSLLVERHLISKNHSKGRGGAAGEDPRGVAISVPDERLSIMVNEEDHLRIQTIRSGLSLSHAWRDIDNADDRLEAVLDYAYSSTFGYLTACPTNVGTGVRMSVMLHLPGLRLTGELEKVKRAAQDMSLAVRGFYGEGSEAVGDLFQISNQTTLGKSEVQILHELEKEIIPRVVEYERVSRRELLAKRRTGLEDQVWRAWGLLAHARLLTTEEAMQALSLVRLGVTLGVCPAPNGASATAGKESAAEASPVTLRLLNQLMLLVQPAHLQRAVGRELDQEQRRAARAALVRGRLARGSR